MLVSDIKSRPLYGTLRPVALATRHVVAAQGEGIRAVADAFAGCPDHLARTTIVYTPGLGGPAILEAGPVALGADALHLLPTTATALIRLSGLLATTVMGTRLYVSGSESFMAEAVAAGIAHGLNHASIQSEHRGSLARRVQCVHCKGFTADVEASPVRCSHCDLQLLVRDHYSRRLGAFMGVCIDAEAPGAVPPAVPFAG